MRRNTNPRFTNFYQPGMGPRLGNGQVAGAYSGFPDMDVIAEECGYPDVPQPQVDFGALLTWVALIAVGVVVGMVIAEGRED